MTISNKLNRAQKRAFMYLSLLTILGPWVLVRCIRMCYFLRFVPSPKRFMDAGCGRGIASYFFARLGLRGLAVDTSSTSFSEASHLLAPIKSVELRIADINTIKEDNFDIVFLWQVLEHVEDDATLLENIRRNLKMKGHLLLSVPGRRSLWDTWDEYSGHIRRYEVEELIKLLSRTGYQVISLQSGLIALHYILLPIDKMLLRVRKISWKKKTAAERTKESGAGFLSNHTTFSKLLRLILNLTLLPFFLLLEAIFARTLFGPSYLVLARRVK